MRRLGPAGRPEIPLPQWDGISGSCPFATPAVLSVGGCERIATLKRTTYLPLLLLFSLFCTFPITRVGDKDSRHAAHQGRLAKHPSVLGRSPKTAWPKSKDGWREKITKIFQGRGFWGKVFYFPASRRHERNQPAGSQLYTRLPSRATPSGRGSRNLPASGLREPKRRSLPEQRRSQRAALARSRCGALAAISVP
jgi:hypothetical protein